MSGRDSLPGFGGDTRAEQGIIVTFENAGGSLWTRHRTGNAVDALRGLCAEAERLDPTHRVVAISTPETVWRDLRGRRRQEGQVSASLTLPEAALCGRAGLRHMLHPRLAIGRRASGVR